MRTRTSLVASVVVAVVLLALGVVSWSALQSIRDAQRDTQRTRESAIAYSDIRAAVAGEAVAEAGYRRAPSAVARERLESAIAEVDRALVRARDATSRRDGPVLANLQLLNQRYVDQVRLTLDAPSPRADDRVAGPALDAIQTLLEAAMSSHRADLEQATSTEIGLAATLQWVLLASFGLALAIVAWTMRTLLREHRRIRTDAEVAKELARTRAALLAEEQRQVGVLRDLERVREDFLAMVTHDLVNPMLVIAWHADLIATTDVRPETRRQAEIIRERARQVQRLVGDLREGAPPSSLGEEIEIDLSSVVADATDAMVERARGAGVELTTVLEAVPMRGDADRLRQVVDNLVGNAVKYTPAGGRVTVEVGDADGAARLRVSDTGIGIPEDQLDLVFESRFRASTAAHSGIEGRGLGLAITKTIVEGHGGSIRAVRLHPRGTAFEVYLPRHPREASVLELESVQDLSA